MKEGCASMKRHLITIILAAALALSLSSPVLAETSVDKTDVEKGIVQVKLVNTGSKKMKAIIEKDGTKYIYTLRARSSETFPLQMGSGAYAVSTLENVSGNQYKQLTKETVTMQNTNENIIYLNSIQMVDWNTTMKAIAKAQELTQGLTSEDEKFDVIYKYMTENFAYDFDKISNLPTDYIPDVEQIFAIKKGICYDYASVMGSMLRSVGISAKLCMGYTEYVKEYHAWNEVYLSSQKKWCVVDATVDAQYVAQKQPIDKIKADGKYKKAKQY
jgi:hypothetical protein